jgi:hypothetical protein
MRLYEHTVCTLLDSAYHTHAWDDDIRGRDYPALS